MLRQNSKRDYKLRDPVQDDVEAQKSTNPDVPPSSTKIPIAPLSLWDMAIVPIVIAFPQALDTARLRQSIKTLSGVWPTISARYRSSTGQSGGEETEWWFELTQLSIPFSTQISDVEEPFEVNTSSQALEILLPLVPGLPNESKSPNGDTPLIAFRLTNFPRSGKSCLGVSIAHILGDANTHEHIIQTLSSIYEQGENYNPDDHPQFELACPAHLNEQQIWHPSEIDMTKDPLLDSALFRNSFLPMDSPGIKSILGLHPTPEVLTFSFKPEELDSLSQAYQEITKIAFLSKVDSLTGWLVSLVPKCGWDNTKTITYTINLRGINVVPENFVGNAVLPIDIDIADLTSSNLDDITKAARVAARVRQVIEKLKSDKEFVSKWVEGSSYLLKQLALNGRKPFFLLPGNHLFVNSYVPFDFVATFGFDKSQVHAHLGARVPRCPRMNIANPVKGGKMERRERDIEVDFDIATEYIERAQDNIAAARATKAK